MEGFEMCVVYVLRAGARGGEEVLLGRKRRGLGVGKVVAPGGKLEPGESPAAAAARELAEETGLRAELDALKPLGALEYVFPFKPSWSQRSHVFVCRSWTGELSASAELDADWLPVAEVPYARMWSDAACWLPALLQNGARVSARFEFGSDLSSVVASDHPAWRAAGHPA